MIDNTDPLSVAAKVKHQLYWLIALGDVLVLLHNVNVGGSAATTGQSSHECTMLGANEIQIGFGRLSTVLSGFQLALESANTGQVLCGHPLLNQIEMQIIIKTISNGCSRFDRIPVR